MAGSMASSFWQRDARLAVLPSMRAALNVKPPNAGIKKIRCESRWESADQTLPPG